MILKRKKNKVFFNKIANDIIKKCETEHKYEHIKISSIAIIGKWIQKNIKYDIKFAGRNDITVYEIYINKKGVSDHFTKLYNAFMYSLGYPALYAFGYVISNNNSFGNKDAHRWSIINIDKKGLRWLPFDVTFDFWDFFGKISCHTCI